MPRKTLSLKTFLLIMGGVVSLHWAFQITGGYQLSQYYQFILDPQAYPDLLWKMYLPESDVHPARELMLPREFRSRARPGDRLDRREHTVAILGVKGTASEAFLWREEERIAVWREWGIPALLLAVLGTLTPLAVAGLLVVLMTLHGPKPEAKEKRARSRGAAIFVLALAGSSVVLVGWLVGGASDRDPAAVGRATEGLRGSWFDGKGYWTGDVAELYRLKRILKSVGEADAAPLHPLVPQPRPFHGYLFIAMDTGPSMSADGDAPVPLKSSPYNSTFAFCAYPAEPGPNKQVWLICPGGFFGRKMDGGQPVRNWPSDDERKQHWGRYCRLPGPAEADGVQLAAALDAEVSASWCR